MSTNNEFSLKMESERLHEIKKARESRLVISIKFAGEVSLSPFMSDNERDELDNIIIEHVQSKLLDRYKEKMDLISGLMKDIKQDFAEETLVK